MKLHTTLSLSLSLTYFHQVINVLACKAHTSRTVPTLRTVVPSEEKKKYVLILMTLFYFSERSDYTLIVINTHDAARTRTYYKDRSEHIFIYLNARIRYDVLWLVQFKVFLLLKSNLLIYTQIVSPISSEDIFTKIVYARFKKKNLVISVQINSNSDIL